ncbi:uncharacterized protein LOC107042481 [Diachasma alloeum]|uniref:uncharacterized protein LOC107042481 n=1 Tax=Diachasma alloeum TaxID=454923 RepID=UPI00073824C6|nr:uncharacterized protein LOC107042481 [Diachasma alloeum]
MAHEKLIVLAISRARFSGISRSRRVKCHSQREGPAPRGLGFSSPLFFTQQIASNYGHLPMRHCSSQKNSWIIQASLAIALNPGDIEQARLLWIKLTQSAHFSAELKTLSRGQRLSSSHSLTRLTAFLDHRGVLRVGGRLKFAQLDCENKHQIIVPQDSQFAQLIIRDAYLRTLHEGTQLTLGQLRRSYWILGGRTPVRSFILKCVPCARQRGIRARQLMGQLPVARLTRGRAFLNTGVDYAEPVSLHSWKGRGHKSYKGWIAIFVCMTTSAVHIEVISDYAADGFIVAYRRFVARRGLCKNLFSDCGTNFLGADKELKKLFSMASKESDN